MYNEYFGFEELPFSIAPDPRYLYMSEQHREALAHLVYGFNSDGGFVLLTGEVGTGKTTVCRCLLEQVPAGSSIAFVLNPKLSVIELLATICDEFHIDYPENNTSLKVFIDLINTYLFKAHKNSIRVVLIIDEAQNLNADVLEQLRLLTNLETTKKKLLQIILLGQPELRDMLSQPELRQLSQRIIARYHLGPLSREDVKAYVKHRLSVAGLKEELFASSTIDKLFSLTGGIPRIINLLCDRALLGTFTQGKRKVTNSILTKAANEVLERNVRQRSKISPAFLVAALILILFGLVFSAAYLNRASDHPPEVIETVDAKPIDKGMPAAISVPVHLPTPEPLTLTVKLQWPVSSSMDESKDLAFRSLFNIWGKEYSEAEPASVCWQAQLQGLNCLRGLGSLNSLRIMNRPVILRLFNDAGDEYYAVLISFGIDTASLYVAGNKLTVSLKDLESHWLGDYTLLWKAPPDYTGEIQPGDSSTAVVWLDRHLSAMNERAPRPENEAGLYDNSLVNEVKRFQLAEGLVPDGIIGTQTIIHLNTVILDNVPTLKEEIKG